MPYPTTTTTEAPLLRLTDHSEPECEVYPNEDVCNKYSNLKRSYPFPKMQQLSTTQAIRKSLPDSSTDRVFQEHCKNVESWEDHILTIPFENENESKALAEETEIEASKDTGDEDDKILSSSNQLPREAPTDYFSVVSDDFSSTTEFENEKDMFSIPNFYKSIATDDDISFCLDLEEPDSEIQVAINDIRKEAEKIETILILDQFKTLQTEFDSMTKNFSLKSMENEDLKMQLRESDNRVAHMELERDLHQADAAKLREDLKTIISKMFDISMYESLESVVENKIDIKEITDFDQYKKCVNNIHRPNNTSHHKTSRGIHAKNSDLNKNEASTTSLTREKMRIIGLIDQPRHIIRRLPLLSDPDLIRTKTSSRWSQFSDADTIHLLPKSYKNQPRRNQNVFRKRNYHLALPRTESVRDKRRSIHSNSGGMELKKSIVQHYKSLSCIDTKSTSLIIETQDEENETKKKRCGIFFRRCSKQRSFSKEDVSILKQQISQLHEMTKTSVAASEKLRKRLTMISRYYEVSISKLQTKVAEVKAEKSRIKVDLANMISQGDHRWLEKSKFEYELDLKNEEISRSKAGRDRGEV